MKTRATTVAPRTREAAYQHRQNSRQAAPRPRNRSIIAPVDAPSSPLDPDSARVAPRPIVSRSARLPRPRESPRLRRPDAGDNVCQHPAGRTARGSRAGPGGLRHDDLPGDPQHRLPRRHRRKRSPRQGEAVLEILVAAYAYRTKLARRSSPAPTPANSPPGYATPPPPAPSATSSTPEQTPAEAVGTRAPDRRIRLESRQEGGADRRGGPQNSAGLRSRPRAGSLA